jgi:hypothetical protein
MSGGVDGREKPWPVRREFKVQEFKVKGKKDRGKFKFGQRENVKDKNAD